MRWTAIKIARAGITMWLVVTFVFFVLSENKMRLDEGTQIGVTIPQEALHIFDADTGRRIEISDPIHAIETA